MIDPNNPGLSSWVDIPEGSDFPIQNLPFGIFSTANDSQPRVGVAIGDQILDLTAVSAAGIARFGPPSILKGSLNEIFEQGVSPVRQRISELLTVGNLELEGLPNKGLIAQSAAVMSVPFRVGDYVDFYSSENHARNLGRLFRPSDPPLMENWKHIPIGYHGRASTIATSGTGVVRPTGQRAGSDGPTFGLCQKLDIELEVGFFASRNTGVGTTLSMDEAESAIGGLVLVNDWSARDIQAWEYRPLGPFLGKSFLTTVSPWVVTLDALEPFRTPGPIQDPQPLGYLSHENNRGLSIDLSVELNSERIGGSNFKDMYWTMAQQLTHVASNGTAIRSGDLYASGTVSGAARHEYGSLIEMSDNGANPFVLQDGTRRSFLQDGDEVVLRGRCIRPGAVSIGFGDCSGVVAPGVRLEN